MNPLYAIFYGADLLGAFTDLDKAAEAVLARVIELTRRPGELPSESAIRGGVDVHELEENERPRWMPHSSELLASEVVRLARAKGVI